MALAAEKDLELALVDRTEEPVGAPGGRRGVLGLLADVLLLELAEPVGDGLVEPEPADLDPGAELAGDPVDVGVVDVEHDPCGRLTRQRAEQPCGVVDLGEAVQLVAGDVEQERVGRRDGPGEVERVGLVELEDREVGLEPPT